MSAALLITTAIATSPTVSAAMAGAGAAVWIALNAGYARALGDIGRSHRRVIGDRQVAALSLLGYVVPLFVSVIALASGNSACAHIFTFDANETEALLITAAALFAAVLGSSLVDWYYIRPRIDAVVCSPPCRASASQRNGWKRVTRRWYIHRGIATCVYLAFVVVEALVVMLMLIRRYPVAAGAVGGVGGIASLFLIFAGNYRSQIPTVATWSLSPAFVLGDDLAYDSKGGRRRGFVLHVSVPVVKLVPLDDEGVCPSVSYVERKNSDLVDADLAPRPAVACDSGCAGLNPECHVGVAREDRRRRWLVLS